VSQLLLGIDIGTASSKAVLATPGGEIVATASRAHQMDLPHPGWAEMDADQIWWADVVALCRELVPQAAGRQIAGVAVSGLGPCLLVCDADGRPLRTAILYGIDGRASAEITELTEQFGGERILARGGSTLSSQAVGPKLLWVQRHEPDVWARTRRWYACSSYVIARLTGEYVLDHHTASQCDPLYDMAENDWAHDWLEQVVPGLEMPRLLWSTEVAGTVTEAAAAETGRPAGTPVMGGTVDAWAEAFSAGVRRPGDLMVMYGSTMFFVQVLRRPTTHPMLWNTAGLEPGSTTLAAGMATSGSLTTWLQQITGGPSFTDLVAEASASPPGSDGLVVLPYFAGERTPIFDPQARGVFAGLTLRHTRGHLVRAVYEGIAYGIRQILDHLDNADEPVRRLVAVGGGTRAGLWTQIVTDVTGRDQVIPTQTIGASYGNALLAAIGTGLVPADTDWAEAATTITPDGSHQSVYDELYRVYCDLYPATRDTVHRLAAVQETSTSP
jgi:xylulokinase